MTLILQLSGNVRVHSDPRSTLLNADGQDVSEASGCSKEPRIWASANIVAALIRAKWASKSRRAVLHPHLGLSSHWELPFVLPLPSCVVLTDEPAVIGLARGVQRPL